ncbi:MAG: hypothetical protein JW846_08225 [Dehalococcoidia bacterium]|nr:hypothetical protein [Dehalococcoidia bacterium]
MGIVSVNTKSILIAVGASFVFGFIFVLGYYVTMWSIPATSHVHFYVDAELLRYYLGAVAMMGTIPVVLGLYRLGLVFIAGASAGWIANCVMIMAMEPLEPTMQPGVYNVFIMIASALTAIVVEVVYQVRRRRKNPTRTSGQSSS